MLEILLKNICHFKLSLFQFPLSIISIHCQHLKAANIIKTAQISETANSLSLETWTTKKLSKNPPSFAFGLRFFVWLPRTKRLSESGLKIVGSQERRSRFLPFLEKHRVAQLGPQRPRGAVCPPALKQKYVSLPSFFVALIFIFQYLKVVNKFLASFQREPVKKLEKSYTAL